MIEIVPNWHPFWVHFPLGLLLTAVGLWLLASVLKRHPQAATLTLVARWNLWTGGLLLIPTLISGFLAYNSVVHDSAGHQAMTRHLVAALLATLLFTVAMGLAWRERQRPQGASPLLLVVLVPAALMLALTGYLGAENVYRHGIGVERLPDPDDHHHGHGHHDQQHQRQQQEINTDAELAEPLQEEQQLWQDGHQHDHHRH